MLLTAPQLAAATGATLGAAQVWLPFIDRAMSRYDITTKNRMAAFLAQMGIESARLTATRESLNYKPAALLVTFNNPHITRFTAAQAQQYGRTDDHPADEQMIANIAYANRMGNGPVSSGEGSRYLGRGPGQLTGKSNYDRCGKAIGFDLIAQPELLERRDIGALAFAWFWNEGNPTGRSLNLLADACRITEICRAVNGGDNGKADRLALTQSNLEKVFIS